MTLANRITIMRLLLVPVFAVLILSYTRGDQWLRLAAVLVYTGAAVSDAIDGFIARAYNQKTQLGAVLDPLADKLMINTGYVFLAWNGEFETEVPAWFVVVILSRDAFIAMGAYLINEYFGPLRVRPRILGKVTTWFQMSTVVVILLQWHIAPYLLIATLLVTVLSFIDYFFAGLRQTGHEDSA